MQRAFALMVVFGLLGFLGPGPMSAWADATTHPDYPQRLDTLFAKLHDDIAPDEAKKTADLIWLIWAHNSSDDAVETLTEATKDMQFGEYEMAEKLLGDLVKRHPDFAEGWNRRATLYYMEGRLDASLDDIAHVLDLEPRHFGALSGKGAILRAQGKNSEALKVMKDTFAINPYVAGLKDAIEQLEKANPEL